MIDPHVQTDPSLAPPIRPTALPPARPNWPVVIGIIGIVFGAWGLLDGVGGIFGAFMTSIVGGMLSNSMPESAAAAIEGMERMRPYILLVSAGVLLIGGLLLAASIGLVLRRPWSVVLILVWAALKLLLVPVDKYLDSHASKVVQQSMANDPNMAGAPMGAMMWTTDVVMMVTVVIGWIFPIFLLIWFTRPGVRRETATWKRTTSDPDGEGT